MRNDANLETSLHHLMDFPSPKWSMREKYSPFSLLSGETVIADFEASLLGETYGRLVARKENIFGLNSLIHFWTCFGRAAEYFWMQLTFAFSLVPSVVLIFVSNEIYARGIVIILFHHRYQLMCMFYTLPLCGVLTVNFFDWKSTNLYLHGNLSYYFSMESIVY